MSPLAKNSGLALVSENSDKSVFYKKENLVQVGGMSSSIVDKVANATMSETPNPDDQQKPDGNKPNPDDQQKPPAEDQKPSEQTYDINSPEFQKLVRDEFYKLLDAHRSENNVPATKHHWAFEESAMIKSKHMIDNDYFAHGTNGDTITYPHTNGGAECIYKTYLYDDGITESKGKAIAKQIFIGWKNSTRHNTIMLKDHSDETNGSYNVDGFAFMSKWNNDEGTYVLKATYHKGSSHGLWDTSDTTNPSSPGYQPKANLSSIPEESIRNITKIFK